MADGPKTDSELVVNDQTKTKIEDAPKNSGGFTSSDGKPMMHVKVYAPFRTYYDDNAFSISAENDTGPFDILPHHKNFMTLVNPCILAIKTAAGEQRIRINRAVMHVKADSVTVFLDV
jgi:hypothetical protein